MYVNELATKDFIVSEGRQNNRYALLVRSLLDNKSPGRSSRTVICITFVYLHKYVQNKSK